MSTLTNKLPNLNAASAIVTFSLSINSLVRPHRRSGVCDSWVTGLSKSPWFSTLCHRVQSLLLPFSPLSCTRTPISRTNSDFSPLSCARKPIPRTNSDFHPLSCARKPIPRTDSGALPANRRVYAVSNSFTIFTTKNCYL